MSRQFVLIKQSENQSTKIIYIYGRVSKDFDPNHPVISIIICICLTCYVLSKELGRELGVSKSYKQLHATLDRQNPWGMSADLSTSNLKKKICLHAEDRRVAPARRSRSPVTWPGAARITREGKFNLRSLWSFKWEHFFGNIKSSTIRERITLNNFQFQFKVPGDSVILCPSYYTYRTFICK